MSACSLLFAFIFAQAMTVFPAEKTEVSSSQPLVVESAPVYILAIKDDPLRFDALFGENKPHVYTMHQISVGHVHTGKIVDMSLLDLLERTTLHFMRDIDARVNFSLYPTLLTEGDSSSERVSWLRVDLEPPADPRISISVNLVKFEWENGASSESYKLPEHEIFGTVEVGPTNEVVAYEAFAGVKGGMALFVYNLETGREQKIVSYPAAVFKEYCNWVPDYLKIGFTLDREGQCGNTNNLEPTWVSDDTLEYRDFVTREIIQVSIQKSE